MSLSWVEAGDLILKKGGSINPSKYPDEVFELYSVPSHEFRTPELKYGSEIGSSKQLIQEGDVLLCKIVPHIRRSWVVGQEQQGRLIGSGEWIIFRGESFWPDYMKHLLISDWFHPLLMQTVSGVGGSLLRARPAEVAKIKLPMPSLPDQKRIAAILDQADTLREKRRASIVKLDELLQSVFLDMFGDPVINPKGWETKSLLSIGSLDRGVSKHRPRNAPELLGGKYPLIQTGDVANSGGYIRNYSSTYSEIGLKQSKMWPKGTLCITIAANIANTGILTFDSCFPDSVVGFISNERSTTEFVQCMMGFIRQILDARATQVAQKNINLAILRELEIPVPPINLQRRFSLIAVEIEAQKQQMIKHGQRQTALFSSLQQRAFRGEL